MSCLQKAASRVHFSDGISLGGTGGGEVLFTEAQRGSLSRSPTSLLPRAPLACPTGPLYSSHQNQARGLGGFLEG